MRVKSRVLADPGRHRMTVGDIGEHNRGTLANQNPGGGDANTRGAAGDQSNLASYSPAIH